MIYGYARVSSKEQKLDRQMVELIKLGVRGKNIYYDKASGKSFEREEYKKLVLKMKAKDVLVLSSLDRLGRNYGEILEEWRYLTRIKKIDIVVVDMPLLDTRNKQGDLTGAFISDLVLQILSYVAETERNNIRKRQSDGIKVAKENGTKFGRPCKTVGVNFNTEVEFWKAKKVSAKDICKKYDISIATLYRITSFKEKK